MTNKVNITSAAILSMALISGHALATGNVCDGVTKTISASDASRLSVTVSKQLKTSGSKILKTFAVEDWTILYVEPIDLEPVYVFYQGDPSTHGLKDLWGGVARPDEEYEIRKWALKTFPGIPTKLAKCFAWTVTKGPGS